WRTDLGRAAGAAAGGGVPVPTCAYGLGGLYCTERGLAAARVDPAGGRVVWSRPAASRPDQGPPQPPVLAGGLVQVLSPDGGRLEALDPATGRPRWTRDVSGYGGRVYRTADAVLLVAADGTVTAVDAATNRERWRRAFPGHALPTFTAGLPGDGGRTAYAVTTADDGSRTRVTAVDTTRGTVRRQGSLPGYLTPVGTAPGGVLLLTESDAQSLTTAVVRYDPATGRARRAPLPVAVSQAGAATRGDMVYLLGADGGLVAVDSRRARPAQAQRWRLETSVSNASALVASGDRLYFSAADGRLLAVDTARRTLVGQTPPRPGRAGSGYLAHVPPPVAAQGRIFASAPEGTVFAVDERDPAHW
ncbi:PQQ-binding-like beta-propeller repeat protein, partial [Streptomyces sp. B1866]|uniref:PQQ-binding-like beta-propeller repeat protein n=1 Tax=Streptomyces sp. B1866 TaxID=3075431 RepID=UPI00288E8595